MEIHVRKYEEYYDVQVKTNNMEIDLGFLDNEERDTLVKNLEHAIRELKE